MSPSRKSLALVLLCTASFVAVVDTTIVSIALPTIRRDLGFSTSGIQWVLNAYALTFGGLLLLLGRVGDLRGRRRLFSYGLALFGAASVLCALAWSPGSLVAGRFLQGVGAAAFVPASLSLLTGTFSEPSERSRAIGIYGAMAALGFVVGMVGGGVLTQTIGWRSVFWVNVPLVLAALVPTPRLLDESRQDTEERRIDVVGAATVTGGLILSIYTLSFAPERGWLAASTITWGLAGVVLLIGFVVNETRYEAPLVPLAVLKRRSVVVPNVAIAFQSMIGIAWLYVLTLYFQEVLGKSPLEAGLLFAPMTIASVIAAPLAGQLAARSGPRSIAIAGLGLVAVGIGTMIVGATARGSLAILLVGMMIGEAGFMFSNVSLTISGTSGIADAGGGLAAGLLNTSIQLGSGFGLGVVATVIAIVLPRTSEAGSQVYTNALRWGLATCLGFSVVALWLVIFRLPRGKPGSVRRT